MSGMFYIGLGEQFYRDKVKVSTWRRDRVAGNLSFPLGVIRRVHHASEGDRTARS